MMNTTSIVSVITIIVSQYLLHLNSLHIVHMTVQFECDAQLYVLLCPSAFVDPKPVYIRLYICCYRYYSTWRITSADCNCFARDTNANISDSRC
jgi:hypothetical protein